MRLVCISDTHGQHDKMPPIPEGDVLVHAGDCTECGTLPQIDAFTKWLGALPHTHKILIAGNHDFCFDKSLRGKSMAAQSRSICEQNNITYLRGESVSIKGLNFFGFPWQPIFRHMAFNSREGELRGRLKRVPDDTHVLISHGPALHVLDYVPTQRRHVGCHVLAKRIEQLQGLKAHIFGHIHESHGFTVGATNGVMYVNASICTKSYMPTNKPIVIDL